MSVDAPCGSGCGVCTQRNTPRVFVAAISQLMEAAKTFHPFPDVVSPEGRRPRWGTDRVLVFATGKTELAKQTAKYIHKDVKKVKLLSPVLLGLCAAGTPRPPVCGRRWAEWVELLSVEGFPIGSFGVRAERTQTRPIQS